MTEDKPEKLPWVPSTQTESDGNGPRLPPRKTALGYGGGNEDEDNELQAAEARFDRGQEIPKFKPYHSTQAVPASSAPTTGMLPTNSESQFRQPTADERKRSNYRRLLRELNKEPSNYSIQDILSLCNLVTSAIRRKKYHKNKTLVPRIVSGLRTLDVTQLDHTARFKLASAAENLWYIKAEAESGEVAAACLPVLARDAIANWNEALRLARCCHGSRAKPSIGLNLWLSAVEQANFPNSLPVAITYIEVAKQLAYKSEFEQVFDLIDKAVAIFSCSVQPRFREHLSVINNIGSRLEAKNRLEDADRVYRQLMHMDKHLAGEERRFIIVQIMIQLCCLCSRRGRVKEAEELLREACEISLLKLDPCKYVLAGDIRALIDIIAQEQLYRMAFSLFSALEKHQQRSSQIEHCSLVEKQLAHSFERVRDWNKACYWRNRVLALQKLPIPPQEEGAYFWHLEFYARALDKNSKSVEAEAVRKAIPEKYRAKYIRSRVFEPSAPSTNPC